MGETGRNAKRFRGGLVSKANRLVYHSTLGLGAIKKKEEEGRACRRNTPGPPLSPAVPRTYQQEKSVYSGTKAACVLFQGVPVSFQGVPVSFQVAPVRFKLSPFRFSGFGFRGSGFRVSGFGFRVSSFGFRVSGPPVSPAEAPSGFKVQGSGFRVQGSGFRVQGSGFKVPAGTGPPQPLPIFCKDVYLRATGRIWH